MVVKNLLTPSSHNWPVHSTHVRGRRGTLVSNLSSLSQSPRDVCMSKVCCLYRKTILFKGLLAHLQTQRWAAGEATLPATLHWLPNFFQRFAFSDFILALQLAVQVAAWQRQRESGLNKYLQKSIQLTPCHHSGYPTWTPCFLHSTGRWVRSIDLPSGSELPLKTLAMNLNCTSASTLFVNLNLHQTNQSWSRTLTPSRFLILCSVSGSHHLQGCSGWRYNNRKVTLSSKIRVFLSEAQTFSTATLPAYVSSIMSWWNAQPVMMPSSWS